MRFRPELGLTFDDVLLVPRHSRIASRANVSTKTVLVPGITLAIPILSANMDTVTESSMAIAMARAGGMGIIHRFMPIRRQVAEVARVKRSETYVVEQPATIRPKASISEAREAMAEQGIGGLMVVDEGGRLVGVISTRDILFAGRQEALVREAMTPRKRLITARVGVDLAEARRQLHAHRLEKLPLIDPAGRLCGLITAQDIVKIEQYPEASKDSKGRLRVGVAVGARASDMERARLCVEAGADILILDIAHGHSENCIEMVRKLKANHPDVPVIAGNVATPEGVRDLAEAGADAAKVGVGSGSICITRIVTGFGVPQLTAVLECSAAAHELGVPLVADGGIRRSDDVVKALAAGASAVMVGSLLAGTEEAPGATVIREGRKCKIVRGMASLSANIERRSVDQEVEMDPSEWGQVVPEGIEAIVPYRGEASDILGQLLGGLRSGLSYAGAETIEELWQRAEFIRITPAGLRESGSHDVMPIG